MISKLFSFKKQIAAVFIAVLVLLAPARPAHAIFGVADVVWDPTTFVQTLISALYDGDMNIKEYVLDPLAYMAAKMAMQSLTESVVNWANGGFEGSPAFITNLRQNFQSLADDIANEFFGQLSEQGF